MDGNKDRRCIYGPHERYIVESDACPLCMVGLFSLLGH